MFQASIFEVLDKHDYSRIERQRLARLVSLLASRAPDQEMRVIFPRHEELRDRLLEACSAGDRSSMAIEDAFLELYAYLHMHEAPYDPDERARVDASGGYWAHAGGLAPLLQAGRFLRPQSVSADLGAGNGLQCLLMQILDPHAATVQIEISARMVEIGRVLQRWLGIPDERVTWRVEDLVDADLAGFDVLYLYRPLRPDTEAGQSFYTRLAKAVAEHPRDVAILSVADALGPFLPPGFALVHDDGQLKCWRRGGS